MTGARLAAELRAACEALVGCLEAIDPARWSLISDASTWSIGKDAEHVAEAAGYHLWIVRRTIGQRVASQRPRLERSHLTTPLTIPEAVGRLRARTEEGRALIEALGPAELSLPTRPARAGDETLGVTIERVLIGHYGTHQRDIERKLGV